MDSVHTAGPAKGPSNRPGILYPVMLITAIALIVFSVVGIATMMGWMPGALSGTEPEMRPASAPAAKPDSTRPRRAPAATPRCNDDCGVVESIRTVESKGKGSGLGAVGGAVVGGILGHQVGSGRGRTAATVVGAGAGAYAGHEIEKNATKSVVYEIRVRMDDGTQRTFYEAGQPAYTLGHKVRVTGQGLIAAS